MGHSSLVAETWLYGLGGILGGAVRVVLSLSSLLRFWELRCDWNLLIIYTLFLAHDFTAALESSFFT